MRVLADTSALVALMDSDDPQHRAAYDAWEAVLAGPTPPLLTTLTLLEVLAVLPRRYGMDAVASFCEHHLPLTELYTVETPVLLTAVDTWLAARRRNLSLVDVVSFVVMRREGITQAFTIDPHFAEQGFQCVPGA